MGEFGERTLQFLLQGEITAAWVGFIRLMVLCETKRNETKWYFAKWYFVKRYFAKWYFAKWYFAKRYFAKWYFAKRYFAKWHRLGLRIHGISSIEFHRNSVRLLPFSLPRDFSFQNTFWALANTCRLLFSGQKSKNRYFTLRFSLFTKLNVSLLSAVEGNPPSGYLILKKCRIFFTNVCQTWSILATSMTLKPLTSQYMTRQRKFTG